MPDSELVTHAWKPGRMKVQWIVARIDDRQHTRQGFEVHPVRHVDVLDTRQEQVFDVFITAEELARALRTLGE